MKSGVIVINKEAGITSQGVVSRVKRLLGEKKAGHTGTLDPLATGVLPVLVGRGVKASEYMLSADKHYKARLTLGVTTDTEDSTGTVLTRCDRVPTEDEVLAAVRGFVGEIEQTPPMYSALKVGGKKLCDLARQGKEVEREARRITVFSLEAERGGEREYTLTVHCSKGTYIRTLCADIGAALGVGGIMSALERTSASVFSLSDGVTLGELEAMSEEEREERIIPTETLFERLGYSRTDISGYPARLIRNGQTVAAKKLGISKDVGERVAIYDEGGFFAIGEMIESDGTLYLKPTKQFEVQ
ncbi:MAG: tRNA pseudouridine(55) synthase TruB [Clostridia bacterium]|nr:tRNA pseudouridine(55) synthase TruB [Clostridia bacterium]